MATTLRSDFDEGAIYEGEVSAAGEVAPNAAPTIRNEHGRSATEPCGCRWCRRGINRYGQRILGGGEWPRHLVAICHQKQKGRWKKYLLAYECWLELNAPREREKHPTSTESASGYAMMVMEELRDLGVIVRVEYQEPLPQDDPDAAHQWRMVNRLLRRYWALRIQGKEDTQAAWDIRLELEERWPLLPEAIKARYGVLSEALLKWEQEYLAENAA